MTQLAGNWLGWLAIEPLCKGRNRFRAIDLVSYLLQSIVLKALKERQERKRSTYPYVDRLCEQRTNELWVEDR